MKWRFRTRAGPRKIFGKPARNPPGNASPQAILYPSPSDVRRHRSETRAAEEG